MTAAASIGTSRRTLFLTFRAALGGTTITYLFNLLVLPFVLHRLGASLFGAWATVSTVLAIGGLADAGVRTEIIRRVADAHGAGNPEALRRAVHQGVALLAALSSGVFVVGALAAPLLRSFALPRGVPGYSAGDVDTIIRVTLAILAVSLVANGYFAALRGVQRGDVENTAIAAAVPVGALATILGVLAGWGLWALVVASATQLSVQFLVQAIAARRLLPSLRFGMGGLGDRAWRAYLGLSGLAFVSQISEVVDAQWDKLIISRYVGSAAVTSFQVGTSLAIQAKVLVVLPLAPMLVAIAELRIQDPERLDALCRRLSKASFVLGGAVFGGIFVFAPAFTRLWLGPEYTRAGDVARLFAVAAVCNLVSAPLGFRAFGEGLHRLAAIGSLVNIGINALLSYVLTVRIGLNGALYGSIAGNAVGVVVLIALLRRHLGARFSPPPFRALVFGVLCSGLGVAVGAGRVSTWPVLVLAIVGFVTVVSAGGAIVGGVPLARPVYLALIRSARWTRKRPLSSIWERAWDVAVRRFDETLTVPVHGRPLRINFGHPYPAFMRRYPGYNGQLVELVHQVHQAVGRPIVVVDVGASVGDTAALIDANCPGAVATFHCVEGDETFFAMLEENLGADPRAQLYRVMLSSDDSTARSLVRVHAGTASSQGDKQVPTMRLDHLLADAGRIDLIKIDTDGFDGRILAGSTALLNTSMPAIQFEWHPDLYDKTGNDVAEPFTVLAAAGYHRFHWFDKYGAFDQTMDNPSPEAIGAQRERCRTASEPDWHYDVIAVPETLGVDESALTGLTFSRHLSSPW